MKLIKAIIQRSVESFVKQKHINYTVEWQKRYLPYSHSIYELENRVYPQVIATIISAAIPDINLDLGLYEIIIAQMVHGPC